jgi:hypothetical protein
MSRTQKASGGVPSSVHICGEPWEVVIGRPEPALPGDGHDPGRTSRVLYQQRRIVLVEGLTVAEARAILDDISRNLSANWEGLASQGMVGPFPQRGRAIEYRSIVIRRGGRPVPYTLRLTRLSLCYLNAARRRCRTRFIVDHVDRTITVARGRTRGDTSLNVAEAVLAAVRRLGRDGVENIPDLIDAPPRIDRGRGLLPKLAEVIHQPPTRRSDPR